MLISDKQDIPQERTVRRLRRLRPGDCLGHINALVRLAGERAPHPPHYVLVGGVVALSDGGRFWHAWLESASVVIDLTKLNPICTKAAYYERYRPENMRFATAVHVAQLVRQSRRVDRTAVFQLTDEEWGLR
jgi:hypothetical protein